MVFKIHPERQETNGVSLTKLLQLTAGDFPDRDVRRGFPELRRAERLQRPRQLEFSEQNTGERRALPRNVPRVSLAV